MRPFRAPLPRQQPCLTISEARLPPLVERITRDPEEATGTRDVLPNGSVLENGKPMLQLRMRTGHDASLLSGREAYPTLSGQLVNFILVLSLAVLALAAYLCVLAFRRNPAYDPREVWAGDLLGVDLAGQEEARE